MPAQQHIWDKSTQHRASTYTTAMEHGSTSSVPKVKVTRKWSEEAVRGSVESNFQRILNESPAQEGDEERVTDDDMIPSLIDDWLSQQGTEDLSTVIYAVSTLSTPISSPATSDGSSTFATQAGLARSNMETLMPPGTSARPSGKNPRKRPREPTSDSTENDLLGVGSFAEGQRPR